jgi:hypothetical protein
MKFTETRQVEVEVPRSVLETDVAGRLVTHRGKVGKPMMPAGIKILSDRLEFRFAYPITKAKLYTHHEIDLFGRKRRIRMNADANVCNGDTLAVTHTVSIFHIHCRCVCCG